MLSLKASLETSYNEETEEFVSTSSKVFKLEHSLASLSKWESVWKKPFLKSNKTEEETLSYIKFMSLEEISDDDARFLAQNHHQEIISYIEDPMTATWFDSNNSRPSRETVTAEVIYYWMISYQIPFECQHWHLQKLITLIRVCSTKNQTKKNIPKSELAARNRALNAKRRAELNSTG